MLGKTHKAFGVFIASSIMLALDQNVELPHFALGCVASYMASTLPDVDIYDDRPLDSAKDFGIMVAFGILHSSISNVDFSINNLVLYLILLVITIPLPHREASHSFIWSVLFTYTFLKAIGCVCCAFWFTIGYISHLLIDLLNKKGIPLLYPIKTKFALKLCESNGVVSFIIQTISVIGCAINLMVAAGVLENIRDYAFQLLKWSKLR